MRSGSGRAAYQPMRRSARLTPTTSRNATPDRGERAMRARLVEPVGIDDGMGTRQRRLADMVVDDDHVEPRRRRRRERRVRGDAAIDRDDDRRALVLQAQQRRRVRAIALALAVGHVDRRPPARREEEPLEQRGGGRAVDIVVAEDGDRLVALERGDEARDRPVHVLQMRRIRQAIAQHRIEEALGILRRDAAARQQAADDLGQAQQLRDGEPGPIGARAVAPALSQERMFDAEDGVAAHGNGFLR